MKVLCLDSCAAVITHRNDGCNDKLKTSLLDLQLHGVHVRLILGNHCSSRELCIGLREADLEGQMRRVDLDGEFPSLNDDGTQISASFPANAARIEEGTKHITKFLRMGTDLR